MPHGLGRRNRRPRQEDRCRRSARSVLPEALSEDLVSVRGASTISRRTKPDETESLPTVRLRLGRQSRSQLSDNSIQAHPATICFALQACEHLVRQIKRHWHQPIVVPPLESELAADRARQSRPTEQARSPTSSPESFDTPLRCPVVRGKAHDYERPVLPFRSNTSPEVRRGRVRSTPGLSCGFELLSGQAVPDIGLDPSVRGSGSTPGTQHDVTCRSGFAWSRRSSS